MRPYFLILAFAFMHYPLVGNANLITGIETHQMPIDQYPTVMNLDWRSPFLGQIEPCDQIVGISGIDESPLPALGTFQFRQLLEKKGVGQDGSPITIKVLKPDGTQAQVSESLMNEYSRVKNSEGRELLSENGPMKSEKDGFNSPWYQWTKSVSQHFYKCPDVMGGYTSRSKFKYLKDEIDRVNFLKEAYPDSQFAKGFGYLFDQSLAHAQGRLVNLTEEDLEYRRFGEIRAKEIATASDAAEGKYLQEIKNSPNWLEEPFPIPDPAKEPIDHLDGKIVRIEDVNGHYRNFITEPGKLTITMDNGFEQEIDKSYFIAGSGSQGRILVPRFTRPVWDLMNGLARYQDAVTTIDVYNFKYDIVGTIQAKEPVIASNGSNTITSATLVPLAIMARNTRNSDIRMFIDLKRDPANPDVDPLFAGEADLKPVIKEPLTDESPPEKVIEAMVAALKYANKDLYFSLFADWSVRTRHQDGTSHIKPYPLGDLERVWDRNRKEILTDVFDVRVIGVSQPRVLIDGPEKLTEVTVIVEHVGQFDDEYRTFLNTSFNRRKWRLQKRGDRPWKIMDRQSI